MGWFNHQLDGAEATIPVDGSEIGRKKPVEGKVVYFIMVQGFKNIPNFWTSNSRIHGTGQRKFGWETSELRTFKNAKNSEK